MPSNHLILCHPLLLLPSIFPSIRVFSNESALLIRWPKCWSFSFNISLPINIQDWFPLGQTGWVSCTAGIFFTIIFIYISHSLFVFYIKKIQPVNPKGNQSWIFIWRTDAEAEAPILWPPDAKNWLIGKYSDAGKDWRQEKGTTEDEMAGWHHRLNGHGFG